MRYWHLQYLYWHTALMQIAMTMDFLFQQSYQSLGEILWTVGVESLVVVILVDRLPRGVLKAIYYPLQDLIEMFPWVNYPDTKLHFSASLLTKADAPWDYEYTLIKFSMQ